MESARRLTRESYTVGWICALSIELTAATAMLDEEHQMLPQVENDDNSYTLGRMGEHNVVIACLPAGHTGLNSAATIASQMRHSFLGIRFGLMVGIGGGAPSEECDIRLGDVVVSRPGPQNGGVVQYDFGRTVSEGRFIPTGSLNSPPAILLTALSTLQARHNLRGNQLAVHLSVMDIPRLRGRFAYQGADNDRLFEAGYDHVGTGPTCERCDVRKWVVRRPRGSTEPDIHYGTIASGNQVMKHGLTRDRIRREFGILCFEMESAGLMNNFPCIVVRGISDYADSHKNDRWQAYAAATAAAYAKELLSIIPRYQIMRAPSAVDVTSAPVMSLPPNIAESSIIATPPSHEPGVSGPFERGRQSFGPPTLYARAVEDRRSSSGLGRPIARSRDSVWFPGPDPLGFQSRRSASGPGRSSTLDTLIILGNHYREQDRLDEAEQMYLQALEGRKNTFGPEHASTLEIVITLGSLYKDLDRLSEAETMFHQALEARRKTLGPEHPSTLEIVGILSNLLINTFSEQDSMAKAVSVQNEVVDEMKNTLGNGHPDTIDAIEIFADMLADQGRLQEAMLKKREVMRGMRGHLWDDNPESILAQWSTTSAPRDQDELKEAALMQSQAVEVRKQLKRSREVFGDKHRYTLNLKSSLASTLMDLGKLEKPASTQRLKRVVGLIVNDALIVFQDHSLFPAEDEESANGISFGVIMIQLLRSALSILRVSDETNEMLEDADTHSMVFTRLRAVFAELHIVALGPNGAAFFDRDRILNLLSYSIAWVETLKGLNVKAFVESDSDTSAILNDESLTVEDKITLMVMKIMEKMDVDISRESTRQNIDVDAMRLKRMVDRRSLMFDMLRQIIDNYNETAKGIIDSIGRC